MPDLSELTVVGKAPQLSHLEGNLWSLPSGRILARLPNGSFTDAEGRDYEEVTPEYRSAFDGDNAMGYLNFITPTLLIGAAARADNFGDFLTRTWEGNNGIVTDEYAAEHPYLSMGVNFVGDALSPLAFSKAPSYLLLAKDAMLKNYRFANLPSLTRADLINYLSKLLAVKDGLYHRFRMPVKTDTPGGSIHLETLAMRPGNGTLETHFSADRIWDFGKMIFQAPKLSKIDGIRLMRTVPDNILLASDANAQTAFQILRDAPFLNRLLYYLTGHISPYRLDRANLNQFLANTWDNFRGKRPTLFLPGDFDDAPRLSIKKKQKSPLRGLEKLYEPVSAGYSTDIMENMARDKGNWITVPSYNAFIEGFNSLGTSFSKYAKYLTNEKGELIPFSKMTPEQVVAWNTEVVPKLGGRFYIDPKTRTTPLLMRYKVGAPIPDISETTSTVKPLVYGVTESAVDHSLE